MASDRWGRSRDRARPAPGSSRPKISASTEHGLFSRGESQITSAAVGQQFPPAPHRERGLDRRTGLLRPHPGEVGPPRAAEDRGQHRPIWRTGRTRSGSAGLPRSAAGGQSRSPRSGPVPGRLDSVGQAREERLEHRGRRPAPPRAHRAHDPNLEIARPVRPGASRAPGRCRSKNRPRPGSSDPGRDRARLARAGSSSTDGPSRNLPSNLAAGPVPRRNSEP